MVSHLVGRSESPNELPTVPYALGGIMEVAPANFDNEYTTNVETAVSLLDPKVG